MVIPAERYWHQSNLHMHLLDKSYAGSIWRLPWVLPKNARQTLLALVPLHSNPSDSQWQSFGMQECTIQDDRCSRNWGCRIHILTSERLKHENVPNRRWAVIFDCRALPRRWNNSPECHLTTVLFEDLLLLVSDLLMGIDQASHQHIVFHFHNPSQPIILSAFEDRYRP